MRFLFWPSLSSSRKYLKIFVFPFDHRKASANVAFSDVYWWWWLYLCNNLFQQLCLPLVIISIRFLSCDRHRASAAEVTISDSCTPPTPPPINNNVNIIRYSSSVILSTIILDTFVASCDHHRADTSEVYVSGGCSQNWWPYRARGITNYIRTIVFHSPVIFL